MMEEIYRFISETPWELRLLQKELKGEYDCLADHITLEDGTKVVTGNVLVTLKTDLPLAEVLKIIDKVPETGHILFTIE